MFCDIEDTFSIKGRGLVVMLSMDVGASVGGEFSVEILRPNGELLQCKAHKEWLLHRSKTPPEREAFLVKGVGKKEVPKGSKFRVVKEEPSVAN